MSKQNTAVIAAFDAPVMSPEGRRLAGKNRRGAVPRSSHAAWDPPTDRRDPVDVLVDSNLGRVPNLVPLRVARMSVSPFTFLRGSPRSWHSTWHQARRRTSRCGCAAMPTC